MEKEKVIDKIRKLQALANSANLNEAEAAAARAQDLIERFRITTAEIEIADGDDSPCEAVTDACLFDEEGTSLSNWRASLAGTLARNNNCTVYISKANRASARYTGSTTKIRIVGTPGNIEIVNALFSHLAVEIDRLCASFIARNGGGKRAANSFRWGAVSSISTRMTEAKAAARVGASTTAMVRVDAEMDRVRAYVQSNLHLGKARSTSTTFDHDAYAAGREAGNGLNLNRSGQVGSGSGQKMLR